MKIGIILTGYYFKDNELYRKIIEESELNPNHDYQLYILSHISKNEIPQHLIKFFKLNDWEIIYSPNIGWDWGCHVQFMNWYMQNGTHDLDYLLFFHDDIKILKNGFIKSFLNKVEEGYQLIGNSKPFTEISSYSTEYPEENYILSQQNVKYESGEIGFVRGSAFFLSFDLAKECLLTLPYQKCGPIELANRSLRMFGAMVTKSIGIDKIGYLSPNHFTSEFISEEMRGKSIGSTFFIKKNLLDFFRKAFLRLKLIAINSKILNLEYPKSTNNIKLNIAKQTLLPGYLNYIPTSLDKSVYSDVDEDDLNRLFTKNKIYRLVISDNLAFEETQVFENLLDLIRKSSNSIDIFIPLNPVNKDILPDFLTKKGDLKISSQRYPTNKGLKWPKRSFIKYIPELNAN